ncbi:MAG: CCA tRNA nucleotidyltransferase [Methanomicrobiales archaeon]|nr:CCA tRNA nucleotidyltransferase [Methanomicrobiales archaeon]
MRTSLEQQILTQIRPETEERDHIHAIARTLVAAVDRSGIAEGMVVGSVARDTWLRGDRDLDIFMLFDPALSREDLEEKGLALARSIASACGKSYREKYAEHPYINALVNEMDVDLVPCYRVSSPHEIQSAVDRTPFHTRYISERIGSLTDDVLLLKQFAKTGGFYGSDQMTEGFAGYLCELLVYNYGGFSSLLEAAATWKKHTFIDIEKIAEKEFADPLVVIDPVDPRRNVAASVSLTQKSAFIEMARGYRERSSPWFFMPVQEPNLSRPQFQDTLVARGTFLYSIFLRTPPLISDIVVPQLRKSMAAIQRLLERNGFVVNRADCCMQEEKSIILFELLVDRLPQLRCHFGPPVWERENAERFLEKERSLIFSGPFIDDGAYVVEIPRPHTHAATLLSSPELLETALGKHVKLSLLDGWTVREGSDCWDKEFSSFLGRFLKNESPLIQIRRRESEK